MSITLLQVLDANQGFEYFVFKLQEEINNCRIGKVDFTTCIVLGYYCIAVRPVLEFFL
jgi:hypothetical protein